MTEQEIVLEHLVRTALMPEGVEHWLPSESVKPDTPVRTALMPEGVEHRKSAIVENPTWGENRFDAGRR